MQTSGNTGTSGTDGTSPDGAGWVLGTLILVAVVANLNLAVANVALPEIGVAFRASQTALDLVSVGFSVGLAGTVLYFGALGDRYGRKSMLLLGTVLAIPTSLLAAYAPSVGVLIVARVLGGVAAGMAFPTTLALITALWTGQRRTRAIALWSAVGGSVAALGPFLAGLALHWFWWGSCFLITLPLAVVAVLLAWRLVPSHVHETTSPVDHLGGVLSILGIVALIVAINFAPTPGAGGPALVIGAVALVALGAFFLRQRSAPFPLLDLAIAGRRIFWVAAVGGLIVFGSLMGAIFIGLQFLQNVMGYSTIKSGAAVIPAALCMLLVAPQSAKLIARLGSRRTLLIGYSFCLAGFVVMLVTWTEHSPLAVVILAFALAGVGVGLAGTPASHSLTGSVPVRRVGMASATSDLQRDLGGSIMQSLLGAILTASYAADLAKTARVTPNLSNSVADTIERSYASAAAVAHQYPAHAPQIISAARSSFMTGSNWAYLAGCAAIVIGAVVVGVFFPRKDDEARLLEEYAAADAVPVA
jgi:MFS transporter, DHA2 family, multidrug resistance protein